MHDSHSCKSSYVDLKGDVTSHVDLGLGLASWVGAHCLSSRPIVETFVPDLVNH